MKRFFLRIVLICLVIFFLGEGVSCVQAQSGGSIESVIRAFNERRTAAVGWTYLDEYMRGWNLIGEAMPLYPPDGFFARGPSTPQSRSSILEVYSHRMLTKLNSNPTPGELPSYWAHRYLNSPPVELAHEQVAAYSVANRWRIFTLQEINDMSPHERLEIVSRRLQSMNRVFISAPFLHSIQLVRTIEGNVVQNSEYSYGLTYNGGDGPIWTSHEMGSGNPPVTTGYARGNGIFLKNNTGLPGLLQHVNRLVNFGSAIRPERSIVLGYAFWDAFGPLPIINNSMSSVAGTPANGLYTYFPQGITMPVLGGANGNVAWLESELNAFFQPAFRFYPFPPAEEDCESCQTICENAGVGSVKFEFGLGHYGFTGGSSGKILLNEENPTRRWYTPKALAPVPGTGRVVVYDANDDLLMRQIYGSGLLVDVVVVNESKYEMRYYNAADGLVPNGVTGLYDVPGGAEEILSYVVENPDSDGDPLTEDPFNNLKISRDHQGNIETWLYTHDPVNDSWSLATDNGENVEQLIPVASGDPAIRIEDRIKTDGAAEVLSHVRSIYTSFPWGEEMTSQISDPDGAALTQNWEYETAEGSAYTKLKSYVNEDGFWERYEYNNHGQLIKTITQYLDAAVGAAENLSRVTTITRPSDSVPLIDYTKTVVTLLGQEVSRAYRRDYDDGYDEYSCTLPGAGIDDPTNLVREVRNYISSEFSGRVRSVKNPDGTMQLYRYQTDAFDPQLGLEVANEITTIVETGQANGAGTAIIDGTRTTSLENAKGFVMVETVEDIASGQILSRKLVTQTDEVGRPTVTQFLDGRTETATYGCCGLESSTDRRGITTTFTEAGTATTQTQLGITTRNRREGRVNIVERIGVDSSLIEQSRQTADIAGRLVQSTAPGNRTTTYATTYNGSGHRVETATLPDGGTRISTYYPDGQLLSVTGTAVQAVSYQYGVADAGGGRGVQPYTKAISLDGGGAPTGEFAQSFVDLAGRASVTRSANGGETSSEYNNLGQLVKSIDADGVVTLFEYDGRGQQTVTALDVNGNGQIDYGGSDRISRTRRFVTTRAGAGAVSRTASERWNQDGANTPVLVSQSDTAVNGDESWTTSGAQVSHQQIAYGAPADWTITSTQPDGSRQIQAYTGGRLVSSVLQDSGGAQLGGTTYSYDAHGRVNTTTDARNGTTTVTYYATDEVQSTTTPAPGGGGGAQTTGVTYDAAGRQDVVTLPDGGQVDYDYYPTGSLQKVSGARTYTVEYAYDSQGRLTTQTTNPGAAGQQVTTWAYEPSTGRLATKSLPGGSAVNYTYTTGGRTATRTNARNIVTTYTYTPAGDLAAVTYSDGTPGVTFAQGRNGQASGVTHAGSTYAYTYNDFGQVVGERVQNGLLDGVALTHSYDALRRRTSLTAATGAAGGGSPANAVISQGFAYDPLVSRLKTVSQGDRSASYSYHANSALVNTIEHRTGGAVKMTDTRVYDQLNRLTSISAASVAGPAPAVTLNLATAYLYNTANQRTLADMQDGTYWTYSYDNFGHVTSADKHLVNGDLMAGRQTDYTFDALGNRTSASFGGDAAGGSMRTIGYTPGAGDRNQYAAIANPGVVVTTGEANAAAAVTVDTNATTRQGDWFAYQGSVDNSAGAVYASLDVAATEGANTDSITRRQLVPAASVTPAYDADGNLTFDGYQDFTWDAENRLTSIEVRDALVPAGAPKYRLEFSYDYSGRRISTRVYGRDPANAGWTLANDTKYIYDGWNCVAEYSGTGLISKSYLWGLDLSGSMQGAGGVGGLLSTAQHLGDGASRHYVAYDGNGNVVGLADADSGEMSATYEYDAFGQVLQMEGPYAVKNGYRFSTKPQEGMTGAHYYGRRWLLDGRWLSRDPIGEEGGVNLYAFVGNDAVNGIDYLGQIGASGMTLGYMPEKSPALKSSSLTYAGSDVKSAVDATLSRVAQVFKSWDSKTKCSQCSGLVDGFKFFSDPDFWDIRELAVGIVGPHGGRGAPINGIDADKLATFGGKVYPTYVINYALWGKIWALCKEEYPKGIVIGHSQKEGMDMIATFNDPYSFVFLYKVAFQYSVSVTGIYEGLPIRLFGSLAFTEYGFTGSVPTSRGEVPRAIPSNISYPGSMEWSWHPKWHRKR